LKEGDDVALLAISVDGADKSNELVNKIESDGEGRIEYALLSDPGNMTINDYGLFDNRYVGQRAEGVPQTASFILDKERKILWANVESNYRMRPSVETLRQEIDKAKQSIVPKEVKTMPKNKTPAT